MSSPNQLSQQLYFPSGSNANLSTKLVQLDNLAKKLTQLKIKRY